jgi:HEAT repeat protein
MIEKAEQDFYFPCESRPRMVVFDKHHRLFKIMRFEKSLEELIYQMARDDDVMGRVRAARELGQFKSEEAVKSLTAVLMGDEFYGVRMAAAISLGEIAFDSALGGLVEACRTSKDPRIRRACLWALGNFRDAASKEKRIDFLQEALDNDQSYFACVAAVRALANIGGDRPYDLLVRSIARTSWQEVIASAVFHGFSHARERRAVEIAIEQSRYGRPVPIRLAAIGYLGSIGKELRKESADDRIVDHLIALLNDPNLRARVSSVRALGKIGNKRALASLAEAQKRECLDMLNAALLDAIKSLQQLKY